MKIIDVKPYVIETPRPHHGGRAWIFVKLTTDNGIEGIGEAYKVPFHPRTIVAMIRDFGDTYFIDQDPFQIERLWRQVYYGDGYERNDHHQHPDHTVLGLLSAFEMACWDIIGKTLDQPVYNLLGGRYHDRLRSYTYLYGDPSDPRRGNPHTDPQLAGERAAFYLNEGFTAVKFDPLIDVMGNADPREPPLDLLENAEAVVRSVREAVGGACDILIGTHGQSTTSGTIRFARRIEQYDPQWFEEPVPPENRDEMARVAQMTTIPIASGERLSTKFEFRELLEKQAASILQMALGRVGGILEAKKISGMAEAYYAQIAPHLYCGPIEAAANIQVDTCSPNFFIQESIGKFDGFHAEILEKPITWEDGYIIPSTEPGLGVILNESVAEAHMMEGL
ncbi:MAG: isomerase [Gammaproteobacteria bacterium]|uniref:Isomerase n=1 Tax=OM182 bacterium MED-G24 TaxID=1986255 RepID=A0A2A5WWQ6_9GAMM|nr:isomerase [Gammaproteobacteria bacterium]PDH40975.1 MAG: isomerase [OM182 bacterium MED-G24]RPG26833.1 MAG: mandelate racemase/muconate lactonizing enzyme family protein [Gammaproteobacteria bacterium TMED50]|tara:strand:- start:16079 stop:17257 length:1179 start_codon:yes stop_codon:yes gene_type:complete